MYLYIAAEKRSWVLLAQGTEKKLQKMWDDIDKLNPTERPYIIITVRKLHEATV